jgi:hypothetical protein
MRSSFARPGLIALALIGAAALAGPAAAQIGTCREEIAQLDGIIGHAATTPSDEPGATETEAARMHRQPTAASVAGAEAQSREQARATLAQARTLDGQGKETECRETLRPLAEPLGL